MTFNELIKTYDVSLEYLNKVFNIPMRTLNSWRRGERRPPNYVIELINHCMSADAAIDELVRREA